MKAAADARQAQMTAQTEKAAIAQRRQAMQQQAQQMAQQRAMQQRMNPGAPGAPRPAVDPRAALLAQALMRRASQPPMNGGR
jgi:hypothetical protein